MRRWRIYSANGAAWPSVTPRSEWRRRRRGFRFVDCRLRPCPACKCSSQRLRSPLGLQALQADEVAREAERRRRLHAQQRSHGRNAELAASDVEAAQAKVDALHYRLDGKSAQAAVMTCH